MNSKYFVSPNNAKGYIQNVPEGCVFLSKCALSNSKACGVNDVLRFLFFDGSIPIKSVKWFCPLLYLQQKKIELILNFNMSRLVYKSINSTFRKILN